MKLFTKTAIALVIVWLYLFLFFYDTYSFKTMDSVVLRFNKKTGQMYAFFKKDKSSAGVWHRISQEVYKQSLFEPIPGLPRISDSNSASK